MISQKPQQQSLIIRQPILTHKQIRTFLRKSNQTLTSSAVKMLHAWFIPKSLISLVTLDSIKALEPM
jgi:hypothetical protein